MKNIIIFLLFFISLGILTAQEKKQIFTSQDEAREAYTIGTSDYYESIDRKNGYKLFAEEDTVSFPYDVIVKMDVVGGTFWVIQKSGTKFVVIKDKKITRRYDCRNKISGFGRLPSPPPPITLISQIQIPGPKGDKGDKGDRGFPGKNGRDGKNAIIQESNSIGKIIFPFSCGIVGGLIGGYGFQKETEIVTETITPGTKVQTGNGTFVYGPQKIKTDFRVEKSFNWTRAAIGFGSGFILGYILNEVIF
jgi:hypothetical protein